MIGLKILIDNLLEEIVGDNDKRTNIFKINCDNLSKIGDLYFPTNLLAWRSLIGNDNINNVNKDILMYYLKRHNVDITNYTNKDIQEKAFNLLINAGKLWTLPVERVSIQNEKVCLFLNRSCILAGVIKRVIENNERYGQQLKIGKNICIKINKDTESNLTTVRLQQIKNVCENILTLQGYNIKEDDADYKYYLTTKSEGNINDESYEKYICGLVKNSETNSKETSLTYDMYVEKKMNELSEINKERLPNCNYKHEWLRKIAEAHVKFEFLSVRPRQSIIVNSNKKIGNNKGGSFVLYNIARINAVLDKFQNEQLSGNYPEMWKIDKVDFQKLTIEDEWCLVYNFILGYPDLILNSVDHNEIKHEFNSHNLCTFLFRLSQKFSIYYRHCRILTQGREHLIPTMMARLYLLKALQIVVNNSLAILEIEPLSRM